VKKIIVSIVFVVLAAMSACVKPPSYPAVPHLTSISVSTTQLNFSLASGITSDSILLTVGFTAGNGDIGPVAGTTPTAPIDPSNHADDSAVIADPAYDVYWYLYEAGDSFLDERATPYVASTSSKYPGISGLIDVYPVLECLPAGYSDTVFFSVFIKDRAGLISNRLWSPKIVINCQ
jgi:hypothetical protein